MSTPTPTNPPAGTTPQAAAATPPGGVPSNPTNKEIKLISHSPLFYWWPVWAFGFAMAAWTGLEQSRFAVVPKDSTVTKADLAGGGTEYTIRTKSTTDTKPMARALEVSDKGVKGEQPFSVHISQHAWLGSVFVMVLLVTMVITNVPLRGLWSFVVLILFLVLGLFITVFHGWDDVFEKVSSLRIYINMAGYLFISSIVFVVWAAATFIFDRRAYIIFTPGQIKVCEHIGDSVKVYPTMGMTFEKQRDDMFRHYILGFGSGDLIVRTSGADRTELKIPNVLGIGWQLQAIEDMIRVSPAAA